MIDTPPDRPGRAGRLAFVALGLLAALLLTYTIWIQSRLWRLVKPATEAMDGAWPPPTAASLHSLAPLVILCALSLMATTIASEAHARRNRTLFLVAAILAALAFPAAFQAPSLLSMLQGGTFVMVDAAIFAAIGNQLPLTALTATALALAFTTGATHGPYATATLWFAHLCDSLWLCLFAGHALTLSP